MRHLLIASMILVSAATVFAEESKAIVQPGGAPSCESQLAVTNATLDIVRAQLRNLEIEFARLVADVRAANQPKSDKEKPKP